MELSQYTRALRSHWKLIWASVLVGIWLAGMLTLLVTPRYAATAKLFISPSGQESNVAQANSVAQSRVASYVDLLQGQQYARQIIDKLSLKLTPDELAKEVSSSVNTDSLILGITITDPSPAQAQLVANTMATEFIGVVAGIETPTPTTSVNTTTGETVTTQPVAAVKATLVQTAGLPAIPASPDPKVNIPLGAILGLLIGVLLALLRHLTDNTVKSAKEIEELTGAATVGGVMYDPAIAEQTLVTDFNAHSVAGEAYRQIRTNLQYVSIDNPPKVLVVTSSVSGEGKTTTAINLALVLAQSDNKVALIEADLRRPRVMRYMDLVAGAGLTNVLAGKATLAELLQPYGDGKLSVLAAGPNPPNPSEMLGSEHMRALLDELRATHDYVIIDAPPLLPVTDAAVLSVLADGVVLVTRWGHTKRDQLRASSAAVKSVGARVVGTVLNMVSYRQGGYSYGYGYGYEYGYEPDPSPRDDVGGRRGGSTQRGLTTADKKRTESPADIGAETSTATPTEAPADQSV